MTQALLDNDVLIKGSCYSILGETVAVFGGPQSVGILGAARFVVSRSLQRDPRIQDRARALSHWSEFEPVAAVMEPSEEAVEVAISIEEAAAREDLPLDGGESQLAAIALVHPVEFFVTGDKRAIAALEGAMAQIARLNELAGRIACLEQLVERLASRIEGADLAELICREREMDKALAICCRCAGDVEIDADGLTSYIEALRRHAQVLLVESL